MFFISFGKQKNKLKNNKNTMNKILNYNNEKYCIPITLLNQPNFSYFRYEDFFGLKTKKS